MHMRGINVRYLLLLFTNLKNEQNKLFVLTEIVARSIKKMIEKNWRALRSPEEEDYKRVVVDHFNQAFGSNQDSAYYWEESLKREMKYFEVHRLKVQVESTFTDFKQVREKLKPRFCDLFERVKSLVGVSLENSIANKLLESDCPFQVEQVSNILPRVKHVHRISFEEGVSYSRLAEAKLHKGNVQEALELFNQACAKYSEAVSLKVDDHRVLYNWAATHLSQAKLLQQSEPLLSHHFFQQAFEKCKRLCLLRPNDSKALYLYGNVLLEHARASPSKSREQIFRKACRKFEKAIRASETLTFALVYNTGNAYLHLSNHLIKSKQNQISEIHDLLKSAAKMFENASKMDSNSANALQNFAACLAKRARICSGQEQRELYSKSFEMYERALMCISHSHETHFDYGNSLYRYSRIKFQEQEVLEAVVLMFRAAEKYLTACKSKQDFEEAFFNFGIVVESILLAPRNHEQDMNLKYLISSFLSLSHKGKSLHFLIIKGNESNICCRNVFELFLAENGQV